MRERLSDTFRLLHSTSRIVLVSSVSLLGVVSPICARLTICLSTSQNAERVRPPPQKAPVDLGEAYR